MKLPNFLKNVLKILPVKKKGKWVNLNLKRKEEYDAGLILKVDGKTDNKKYIQEIKEKIKND